MLDPSATRIERVNVYGYDLTYAHGDYVMSGGRVVNRLPSTVVRITSHVGRHGLRRRRVLSGRPTFPRSAMEHVPH